MNFIDRVFCLVLGHVWEAVPSPLGPRYASLDARHCPHCTRTMGGVEAWVIQRRRGATQRARSWPKRCW